MPSFDDLVGRAFSDDFFSDPFADIRGFGGHSGLSMGMSNGHRMLGSSNNINNRHREDDFFGGSMLSNFNFGDLHSGSGLGGFTMSMNSMNMGRGGQGTVISKSYVSTVKYDENGNPVKKEYTSQGIDQYTNDGTKISEKKQGFKDYEKGIKKASHQRTLNDVGQKIIKTKDYKNNHENEEHYLHGIREGKNNRIIH